MQDYIIAHGGRRPKSKRVEREIKSREPKIIENTKEALILYGKHTSETIKKVLGDFVRK
jgi:hypothetical protein